MPASHDWYTVLSSGAAPHTQYPPLPVGPWRGESAASAALSRWRDRLGPEADQAIKAMSVRVSGPFCTREKARFADITDVRKCKHPGGAGA